MVRTTADILAIKKEAHFRLAELEACHGTKGASRPWRQLRYQVHWIIDLTFLKLSSKSQTKSLVCFVVVSTTVLTLWVRAKSCIWSWPKYSDILDNHLHCSKFLMKDTNDDHPKMVPPNFLYFKVLFEAYMGYIWPWYHLSDPTFPQCAVCSVVMLLQHCHPGMIQEYR